MGWFKEAMCNHQFEQIGELKDSETNTTAIKVIRMCSFCGYSFEKTFTAPDKAGVCSHRWNTYSREKELDKWGSKTDRMKIIQTCCKCGVYKSSVV